MGKKRGGEVMEGVCINANGVLSWGNTLTWPISIGQPILKNGVFGPIPKMSVDGF